MLIENLNEIMLIYLNKLWNNPIIEKCVWVFADAPIFFIPIFLIVTWLILTYKNKNEKKNELLIILYSTILWIIIAIITQHLFHFDRPENYIKNTWKLLLKHIPDASFPSDHATVSFAFLTSLYYAKYKKTSYIFFPFALIMVISRVIAWVHWPLDIIVWIIIWITSSYITFKYIKKLKFIKKLNQSIIKITWYIKL